MLAVLVVVGAACVHAQEMDVIRVSGGGDEFSLAEIDSITFSEHDSLAASGLRDVLQSTGDILRVHTASGISQFLVTNIDSVCFADELQMIIHQGTGDSSFNLAEVDSLTFASSIRNKKSQLNIAGKKPIIRCDAVGEIFCLGTCQITKAANSRPVMCVVVQ